MFEIFTEVPFDTLSTRFHYDRVEHRRRNHLPHVDADGGVYFVTFCLADAFRPLFIQELRVRRRQLRDKLRRKNGVVSVADSTMIEKQLMTEALDEMDRGHGSRLLEDPRAARIVVDSLKHFDGDRYHLFAYSVMPNHVHATFRAFEGFPWWRTVGAWKSFTAKEVNRLLGRTGTLWQDDNFDRLVRDSDHLSRVIGYIVRNPEKAGLENWPWVEQLIGPPYEG